MALITQSDLTSHSVQTNTAAGTASTETLSHPTICSLIRGNKENAIKFLEFPLISNNKLRNICCGGKSGLAPFDCWSWCSERLPALAAETSGASGRGGRVYFL